ncbi:EAL domain-containing protein [Thalassotalea sp. LPB0316]|uniref:EAL domain-containing protein n=1 Tax=Thalassotalea sp. LPB0316 TaxID=2769490 RepID=UPI0018693CFF|nr:EAL domain-containing protein [Thalassotalea sp. LPB0316]QOL26737.1 EAL domain-containing protein [Thalassotalea sp. LPB0316]
MTRLVKKTHKKVYHLLGVFLIAGYFLALASFAWQVSTQQQQRFSLIAAIAPDLERLNQTHSLNEVLGQNVISQVILQDRIVFEQTAGSEWVLKQITLAPQLSVVAKPVWFQVVSSPIFWLLTSGFGLLLLITVKRSYQFIDKALAHVTEIEHWANSAIVQGNYPAVTTEHPIGYAINHLRKSMLHAQNQDSLFDKAIKESALLDDETGIGNKAYFNSRLSALMAEEDVRGAVYIIQCQGCDTIHSLYGHEQAIHVVEMIIQSIEKRFENRANFYLARCQEYELALLVPHVFVKEAEKLAQQILKGLLNIVLPVGINKDDFCHIGMSYFKSGDKAFQVLAEADMALRTAQLQGPSQWFMYDDGEIAHESAKGSLKWRTFLENAIRNNSFVIFFQPVIERFSDNILHHEVLTKVRDEKGELISARVFLPMAKKCGLSAPIDLLVFKQVCKLLTYEQDKQDCCSLNLSVDSLLDKSFIEKLHYELKQYPQIAPRLIIEISEYQLVNHLTELKPILFKLTLLGVQLLADKVGQYVVSAQYLKQLPIRYVKLHRSIVMNIEQKPENQVFVQSMKILCEPLKVKMFALGVEDQNEWRTLTKLGVQGGQGHYFTEPIAQVAKAIGH